MSNVIPINQRPKRLAEAGRIRFGIKVPTRRKDGTVGEAPQAIDTFRFTSPDESSIRALAALYGGEAARWDEPKAAIRNQWQVVTNATEIGVVLAPEALSCWYEQWTGGGCVRRCDGITCQVAVGEDIEQVECLCAQAGQRTCKPYTRLNVVLPQIAFSGFWRLETKGEYAATELAAMEEMIQSLSARTGPLRAKLALERRDRLTRGKKRSFMVPTLKMDASVDELLAGTATLAALAPAAPEVPALTISTPAVGQWRAMIDASPDQYVVEEHTFEMAEKLTGELGQTAEWLLDAMVNTLSPEPIAWHDLTPEQLRKVALGFADHLDGVRTISRVDTTGQRFERSK
jgi:hypothetical protein